METFKITVMAMWIVFGAIAFGHIYIKLGGADFVSEVVLGIGGGNPWFVITAMLVIVFILGCFIDTGGITWIVGPLAFPIVKGLGFDPIWFAVLFIIDENIGFVTPPFGYNLFYLKAVVPKEITLTDIYRSVWWTVGIQVLTLVLVMLFPQIALWFPSTMSKYR